MNLRHFNYESGGHTAAVPLDDGTVHLWFADLSRANDDDERLLTSLSDRECQESRNYRDVMLQRRCVATRGITRTILARYCGIEPRGVPIERTKGGKPFLSGGAEAGGLSFNLSHCDDTLLLGVCRARPIGVDIERVKPVPDKQAIAERWLSHGPGRPRRSTNAILSDDGFIYQWTRHEAVLKAHGRRLFDEEIAADTYAAWNIQSFRPGAGYWAAVCVLAGSGHE